MDDKSHIVIKPTADQVDPKKYAEMIVLEFKLIQIGKSRLTSKKRQAVLWEAERLVNVGQIQMNQLVNQ